MINVIDSEIQLHLFKNGKKSEIDPLLCSAKQNVRKAFFVCPVNAMQYCSVHHYTVQ